MDVFGIMWVAINLLKAGNSSLVMDHCPGLFGDRCNLNSVCEKPMNAMMIQSVPVVCGFSHFFFNLPLL